MNLTKNIQNIKAQGKLALIPYLPYGYPDRDTFWKLIIELDKNGVNVIEIGVPFSNPIADGEVVENAILQSLSQGLIFKDLIDDLSIYRDKINCEIVFMGYFNSFYKYGLNKITDDAKRLKISGFIVADSTIDETEKWAPYLVESGINLVPLIGLNTSVDRMKIYAKAQHYKSFVYFVTVLGVTGIQEGFSSRIDEKLREVKEVFDIPVVLGFGISSISQLNTIKSNFDGVVFGSSLIQSIDRNESIENFMNNFRN